MILGVVPLSRRPDIRALSGYLRFSGMIARKRRRSTGADRHNVNQAT